MFLYYVIIKVKKKIFQWNAVFMTMRFVLSSQGMPGDERISRRTGITGERYLSVCLLFNHVLLCTVLSHFGLNCQTYKKDSWLLLRAIE